MVSLGSKFILGSKITPAQQQQQQQQATESSESPSLVEQIQMKIDNERYRITQAESFYKSDKERIERIYNERVSKAEAQIAKLLAEKNYIISACRP